METTAKVQVSKSTKSPKDSGLYVQIIGDTENEANVVIRVNGMDYIVAADDLLTAIENVQNLWDRR